MSIVQSISELNELHLNVKTEAVSESVREKRCSEKFRKIDRKTPVSESLF